MKLRVSRYSLEIIPEGPTDEGYIEEVLGLKENGQSVALKRVNSYGLGCIAYLKAEAHHFARVVDLPENGQIIEDVRALRRVLGLFDGAMPISPREALLECIEEARRLASFGAPRPAGEANGG